MTKEKKIMKVIHKLEHDQIVGKSFFNASLQNSVTSKNYTLALSALDKIAKIISKE